MVADNQIKALNMIAGSVARMPSLVEMTDREVGYFLLNQVWCKVGLFSPLSDLLEQCVDRLLRSTAGRCEVQIGEDRLQPEEEQVENPIVQ